MVSYRHNFLVSFFSPFRRALKATFVLIPLFGVHLVVTIYRAKPENPIYLHYERISEIISNTQVSGAIITEHQNSHVFS